MIDNVVNSFCNVSYMCIVYYTWFLISWLLAIRFDSYRVCEISNFVPLNKGRLPNLILSDLCNISNFLITL